MKFITLPFKRWQFSSWNQALLSSQHLIEASDIVTYSISVLSELNTIQQTLIGSACVNLKHAIADNALFIPMPTEKNVNDVAIRGRQNSNQAVHTD